jgi:uncharacterized protein (TIGR02594 family)
MLQYRHEPMWKKPMPSSIRPINPNITPKLPRGYEYLLSPNVPNMVKEAVRLYGTTETPGSKSNAIILDWHLQLKRAGLKDLEYSSDHIPWCGLFMAIVAKNAGWFDQIPRQPLWARNWVEFGQEADAPMLGDVMTFTRFKGGHVGVYVAEDELNYHILGGNQNDCVCIIRDVKKDRLLQARRPKWRVAQPDSVRRIILSPTEYSSPKSKWLSSREL